MSAETQELERSALERKDRDELHTIATALGGKPTTRAKKADIVDMILQLAGVAPATPEPGSSSDDAPAAPARRTRARKSTATTDERDERDERDDRAGSNDRADQREAAEQAHEAEAAIAQGIGIEAESDGDEGEEGGREAGTDVAPPRRERTQVTESRQARAARGRPGGSTETTSDQRGGDQDGQGREQGQREQGQREQGQREQGQREQGQREQGQREQGRDQGQRDQGQRDQAQGGTQTQPQPGGEAGQPGEGESGNRRRRRRGRDRERGVERPDRPAGAERPEPDQPFVGEPVDVEGLLDLRDEGYGFLRLAGYLPSKDDVYVSVKQARQFALRKGDRVSGTARPAGRNEKNPAMLRIDTVNGLDPEQARQRPRFEDLTPLFPDSRLRLEAPNDPNNMTARIIDLLAPIGKGQRGLIVSPPKAGKTTVMKQIARSIETNNPEVHLIVLLVDERPEEVTDMKRWVKGEVAASTFDRPAEEHTMVAELTIERAKRMVEEGKDVVIILDGITRLARAYNLAAPTTGRVMSGGIDTGALYPPKKFFGAARNIEEGGSLTILATALVETGSRMDEVIFEEFKGTGNMELRLDRKMAERRIYPAIDVDASSTRHEELLYDRKQLQLVWKLRRVLSGLAEGRPGSGAGLEMLVERLGSFKTNDAFLAEMGKVPSA